jgi:hypothetical protein
MFGIQVAVRSEVWVCGRWIAGFACSNPSRGMYIRLFYGCVFMRRADYLSRGVIPIVMCLSVKVDPRK